MEIPSCADGNSTFALIWGFIASQLNNTRDKAEINMGVLKFH